MALRLQGVKVLVVEDEFLLALMLEEDLVAEGAGVLGPFSRLETARAAAAQGGYDVAVLDVNLADAMVFPLADDLVSRGSPFVFLTGYDAAQLPERFRSTSRIAKPYQGRWLIDALARLTGRI